MTRLAVACYVLAVLALALSAYVGWAAAVVSCAALTAAVVLMGLEERRTLGFDTAVAMSDARREAAEAREEVKKLRGELHATLERIAKQPRGY